MGNTFQEGAGKSELQGGRLGWDSHERGPLMLKAAASGERALAGKPKLREFWGANNRG